MSTAAVDRPVDRVLAALAARGCALVRVPDPARGDAWDWRDWRAHCPAHADAEQWLAIREKVDGVVLLYCHAGCSTAAVLAALGLGWRDLYPPKTTTFTRRR